MKTGFVNPLPKNRQIEILLSQGVPEDRIIINGEEDGNLDIAMRYARDNIINAAQGRDSCRHELARCRRDEWRMAQAKAMTDRNPIALKSEADYIANSIIEPLTGNGKMAKKKPKFGDNLSDEAVMIMRRSCMEGLGFDCTFVDDDMHLLVGLAQRAVLAGLDSDCTPDMQRRFRAASEPDRAGHEKELGRSIVSSVKPD